MSDQAIDPKLRKAARHDLPEVTLDSVSERCQHSPGRRRVSSFESWTPCRYQRSGSDGASRSARFQYISGGSACFELAWRMRPAAFAVAAAMGTVPGRDHVASFRG